MTSDQTGKSRRSERRTPDLSQFPDLVVIYLGMKVRSPGGVKTLLSFGPKIQKSVAEKPDGLLLHENFPFFSGASPRRYAPVLAGFRLSRALVAFGNAQTVVAEVPARHRRYGVLA